MTLNEENTEANGTRSCCACKQTSISTRILKLVFQLQSEQCRGTQYET